MSRDHTLYFLLQMWFGLVPICQAVWTLPFQARLAAPKPARVDQGRERYGQHYFDPAHHEKTLYHSDRLPAETAHQTMKDVAWILNGFNITMGTPPQSIPVALSIETQFTMIQSSECQTDACMLYDHPGFNSSISTTFEPSEVPFRGIFGLVDWIGTHAEDTANIAGVDISNMPFRFAKDIHYEMVSWYFEYDGVIGLSPHSSTWTTLKERGLLEKNIIGIKHPSGPLDTRTHGERDDGEITLGGISPDFENATFMDFPLADGDRAASWATRTSSISFSNSTYQRHGTLNPMSMAIFYTAFPFISIPTSYWRLLNDEVGHDWEDQIFGQPVVSCDKRESMGSVTISLGEGDSLRNFTLSPYDYMLKLHHYWDNGEMDACLFAVIGQYGEDDQYIGLGWPFMRNYYLVLDDDEKRIRLAPKPDAD